MATNESFHANPYSGNRHANYQNSSSPHASAEPFIDTDVPTHPVIISYLFWVLGFLGAHRFYLGRPISGAIWFFTGGLFLVGWIVDAFLIPSMSKDASHRYPHRTTDYSVAWLLLLFLGMFGMHRFYMGKLGTGIVFLLTGGLFGVGYVYDILTLNEQIEELPE